MHGDWLPVASNPHIHLPYGTKFEWASIESNSEILNSLADGASFSKLPLLARILSKNMVSTTLNKAHQTMETNRLRPRRFQTRFTNADGKMFGGSLSTASKNFADQIGYLHSYGSVLGIYRCSDSLRLNSAAGMVSGNK